MIGERLSEIRKDHKDKQKDLAEKLHVTIHTVRSWEQEKSSPSNEMLVRICRLYHVSSDYLLGLSDHDPFLYQNIGIALASATESDLQILQEHSEFLRWRHSHDQPQLPSAERLRLPPAGDPLQIDT